MITGCCDFPLFGKKSKANKSLKRSKISLSQRKLTSISQILIMSQHSSARMNDVNEFRIRRVKIFIRFFWILKGWVCWICFMKKLFVMSTLKSFRLSHRGQLFFQLSCHFHFSKTFLQIQQCVRLEQ